MSAPRWFARQLLCLALALTLPATAMAQKGVQVDTGPQLIPKPVELQRTPGWFVIDETVTIAVDPTQRSVAELLQEDLEATTGRRLKIRELGKTGPPESSIVLVIDEQEDTGTTLGDEGYFLWVSPARIVLLATTRTGLLYGCQTLRQLLPLPRVICQPEERIRWVVPCVTVADHPRFEWRGLMLDSSRTFQSPEYLKKTIDRMLFYKLNTLHLHLTDDQGWRVEIERYPELTAKGARFPKEYGEPPAHQGFYSKNEIRELVAYAAERGVTIVPEIEMPGHSLAALACYPELSCTGGPFEIHPFFRGPGIQRDVFCAGNDATFEFLENVLAELLELFPSKYVHIGGDEVPKDRWQACERCQERIRAENLKDESELQSWFVKRIERYLSDHGRVLIGWDEILEGGLAPRAAVMSWRGTAGGIAAARAGHPVVMSPTSHCYFDYSYERIDAKVAYGFEPVPAELDEAQAALILGLQANFWSHIDREPERVDHQLFPRLLAIAERGWSPKDVRDWEDFRWRMKVHLVRLDDLGVHYRRDPLEPFEPPIGSWSPAEMSVEYSPLTWDVTEHLNAPGRYRIRFRYTFGSHRLGIEKVELLVNGAPVSADQHRGVTGIVHQANDYYVELPALEPGAKVTLRASARSEGGTDSNGEIYIEREEER